MARSAAGPLVTVLLPVWNGERFLRPAVESILGQTFADFEFLVVDDGSTDGTPRILAEYTGDRRLRVLRNLENRGLVASLNVGLGEARGKYVARMDADDVSHKERLAIQVSHMESHPAIVVLGTGAQVIDEAGRALRRIVFPTDDVTLRWCLCFFSPIVHAAAIMRRDDILLAGAYDPAFVHAEDYDLFDRLRHRGRIANIPEALYAVRVYSRSISRPEYQGNATEISRRVIESYLGDASVDVATARLLFGDSPKRTGKGLQDVLQLMKRLETAFLSLESVPEADTKRISKEAAMRLLAIGSKGAGWSAKDRILLSIDAVRRDPLVVGRAVRRLWAVHAVPRLQRWSGTPVAGTFVC